MAERRMFAKRVVCTDRFCNMSVEAQCLYFHLGMIAYNKGIVINARTMSKVVTGSDIAVDELVENKYLVADDENYRIVHWYENNGIGETAKKRNNYLYRKWRETVINRDGCCVVCGATEKLVVHHIKPFAEYEELRLDINNGVTLCEKCHRRLHGLEKKYGEEKNV